MNQNLIKREQWSSKLGFIFAAVGSAVGLGNLWGFAYRSSQGGGAAFVLLYILVVLVICLPVFVAEFSLGRNTATSAFLAPIKAAGQNWAPLGWLFLIAPLAIASYYSVIMGWTIDMFFHTLFNKLPENKEQADELFNLLSGGNRDMIGQIFSLFLGGLIISGGIKKGIEKINKICMPLLFILLFALVIWAAFLNNALDGYYNFILNFDLSQLFDPDNIKNAFSQAFFSLSLGIGIMVTYSSYLNKEADLPKQSFQIASLDTLVGLMAGLITFPIMFTFGFGSSFDGDPIGALFKYIPTGLGDYGFAGRLVAILFFGLIYIAAITSLISLLEIPVSTLMDKFNFNRKKATFFTVIFTFFIGVPSAINAGFIGKIDDLANILLILGGFLVSFLLAWVVPKILDTELINSGTSLITRNYLKFMLKYITPILISAGLLVTIKQTLIKWIGN